MQVDGDEPDGGGEHGGPDEGQVQTLLEAAELGEPVLEGDRQQEAGQELGARLRDPLLLQEVGPVAIELSSYPKVSPGTQRTGQPDVVATQGEHVPGTGRRALYLRHTT